jgi:hypothetical protein
MAGKKLCFNGGVSYGKIIEPVLGVLLSLSPAKQWFIKAAFFQNLSLSFTKKY